MEQTDKHRARATSTPTNPQTIQSQNQIQHEMYKWWLPPSVHISPIWHTHSNTNAIFSKKKRWVSYHFPSRCLNKSFLLIIMKRHGQRQRRMGNSPGYVYQSIIKEKELLCFKGGDLQYLYNVSKGDNERFDQSSTSYTYTGVFDLYVYIKHTHNISIIYGFHIYPARLLELSREWFSTYLAGKIPWSQGDFTRAKLIHCTLKVLNPAMPPKVENSTAWFVVVGDWVRAFPV